VTPARLLASLLEVERALAIDGDKERAHARADKVVRLYLKENGCMKSALLHDKLTEW